VRAAATGSGSNYGIQATTGSYNGLAGFFQNTGTTPDLTYGTALRVLGAGATGREINRRNHAAGAGEFIGYVGVTGASSLADGGAGVLALNGAGDYGIYATSNSPQGAAGYFWSLDNPAVFGAAGNTPPAVRPYLAGGVFTGFYGVYGEATSLDGYGVYAKEGAGDEHFSLTAPRRLTALYTKALAPSGSTTHSTRKTNTCRTPWSSRLI
jgi:hypothetical protein